MTAEYTDKQIANGRRKLRRAERWRRDNPQAWGYIVATALERAAHRQPISGRGLIEAARGKDFTDRAGRSTRTNNDYAAIVARWIAAEHPETAGYIEHRKTAFDGLMT